MYLGTYSVISKNTRQTFDELTFYEKNSQMKTSKISKVYVKSSTVMYFNNQFRITMNYQLVKLFMYQKRAEKIIR